MHGDNWIALLHGMVAAVAAGWTAGGVMLQLLLKRYPELLLVHSICV